MINLNTQIIDYLSVNNISYTIGDYQTGQPEGQKDQILHWDAKLGTQPTENQLRDAQTAKEVADAAVAYKAKRAAEYPTIGDQLDALWKGGDAATAMLAQVQAVKAKYPKP